MSEGPPEIPTSKPEQDNQLEFEWREYKPGIDQYIFENVVVNVDTTESELQPELSFGVFEMLGATLQESLDRHGQEIFEKPERGRAIVDMKYIDACIRKVVETTGIHEFRIKPYQDGYQEARLRLFKRYWNIEETKDDHGYPVYFLKI